jgi:hypothetical protein
MQGRAAAAAGNVRSVHTGAPKLKTAAAATTRKHTTQRAHLDSEGHALNVKSLRCFISLLHLFLMSLSVFFSRIEPGTLHGTFGSVTADAEARLILNARAISF